MRAGLLFLSFAAGCTGVPSAALPQAEDPSTPEESPAIPEALPVAPLWEWDELAAGEKAQRDRPPAEPRIVAGDVAADEVASLDAGDGETLIALADDRVGYRITTRGVRDYVAGSFETLAPGQKMRVRVYRGVNGIEVFAWGGDSAWTDLYPVGKATPVTRSVPLELVQIGFIPGGDRDEPYTLTDDEELYAAHYFVERHGGFISVHDRTHQTRWTRSANSSRPHHAGLGLCGTTRMCGLAHEALLVPPYVVLRATLCGCRTVEAFELDGTPVMRRIE